MIARRIIVSGRVQGVFYRGWTVETARSLGLTGWVRNRRDGDVEILAIGREEKVKALAELCRKGPPAARVTEVTVSPAEPEQASTFEQRPTA